MRWGRWYLRDAEHVVLVPEQVVVRVVDLGNPVAVADVVLEIADRTPTLTPADVVHLSVAANQLSWLAFNFDGVGDWTDERGSQRGCAHG